MLAIALLAVVTGGFALTAVARHAVTEAADSSRREAVTVLALAVVAAAAQFFVSRFDADDVFYLNRASWIRHVAHLSSALPTADGMFSAGTMHSWANAVLPSSFEPAIGLAARVLHLPPGVVAHGIVAPLVAGCGVAMAWTLGRALRPDLGLLIVLGMVGFLLFDGGRNASLGNTTFFRASQGKVVFVLVVLPWLWLQIARRSGRPRAGLGPALLVGSIAAVGVSPTAIIILPVLLFGVFATTAGSLRGRLGALVPAGGYIAVVGVCLALAPQPARPSLAAPTSSGILQYVFDGWVSMLVVLALVLLGIAAIRPASARRCAGLVFLVVVVIVSLNPILRLLAAASNGSVLWRLPWALPLAVLAGLGLAAVASQLPAGLRAGGAIALGVLVASSGGINPVLRRSNNVRLGFSLTDYPSRWAHSASHFRALVGRGLVMGPDWLNFTVAMQEPSLIPAWTRDDYVSDAASMGGVPFMLAERRAVRSVWTDGVPSPGLGRAVAALGIRGICAPPGRTEPFVKLGFDRRGELGRAAERCVVMTRAVGGVRPVSTGSRR